MGGSGSIIGMHIVGLGGSEISGECEKGIGSLVERNDGEMRKI